VLKTVFEVQLKDPLLLEHDHAACAGHDCGGEFLRMSDLLID
jgi:hypothetical protein